MIPFHDEKVDYSFGVMETSVILMFVIFQSSLLSSGVSDSYTSLNLNSFLESDLRSTDAHCYRI